MMVQRNAEFADIVRRSAGRTVVIFGAGATGQYIFFRLRQFGVDPAFFVDNRRAGEQFCGLPIRSPYDLLYEDAATLTVVLGLSLAADAEAVLRQLEGLGCMESCLVEWPSFGQLYAPVDWLDPLLGYSRESDLPGIRLYPGRSAAALKLAVLGGSTSDWSFGGFRSWPEFLREELAAAGIDVTLYNGAIAGYFSGQELLKLLRDILPLQVDLLIVMDGVNDGNQQRVERHPFYHPYQLRIFDGFSPEKEGKQLAINRAVKGVLTGVEDDTPRVESWLRNLRTMRAVCREFGIVFLPFLQPTASVGRHARQGEEGREALCEFYRQARAAVAESGFITDASAALEEAEEVYFDHLHYNENGNRVLARFVAERILPELRRMGR